jgi:dUTP pyrophosphatase
MLRVKLLEEGARLPVVAHPGEDLGYDLFALEDVVLASRTTVKVRTGIAVEARHPGTRAPLGLLVRDRSSMASRGIATTGGVIDAGYRGEILVLMTNLGEAAVELKAGEKIAQMIPVPVLTGAVEEVASLEESARAAKGFGSSGRRNHPAALCVLAKRETLYLRPAWGEKRGLKGLCFVHRNTGDCVDWRSRAGQPGNDRRAS